MSESAHEDVEGGVEHGGVKDLDDLAGQLLDIARDHTARRASRTLVSVRGLRSTLIVLAAGGSLSDHESPGAATVQVLRGSVVLHTPTHEWQLPAGRLAQIPDERHGLRAEEDTAVLLTVALG